MPPATSESSASEAVVDLLGALAYAELCAFEHLAEDSRLAPTLGDRAAINGMAAAEFGHFARLSERLTELGADPEASMAPFVDAIDAFHYATTPGSWAESLVKAYVGDALAADFYREVAAYVDADTRALVHEVLADEAHVDFAVEKVRAGIAADPRVAGRLALWGRRLVGEALSQAQRVAADRDALTSLLTGTVDRPGLDLAAISRTFSRLVENHTRRMARLGLQP